MSCTEKNVGRGLRSRIVLVVLALWGSLTSCASPVSPDFPLFAPRVIAVLPVENATEQSLEAVNFSGFLQSALMSTRTYDILELVRGAVEEAFLLKGYELVAPAESRADRARENPDVGTSDHDAVAADAELRTTILSWTAGRGLATQLAMAYRLELVHLASGNVIFSRETSCIHKGDPGAGTSPAVDKLIRRCIRRGLEPVPEREQ